MNLFLLSSRSDRGFQVFQCPRERFLDLEPFSPFCGSSTCSKSDSEAAEKSFVDLITIATDDNESEEEEDEAEGESSQSEDIIDP